VLPVAIKRFREEVKLATPKTVQDLSRELQILAKISHPNLLHLYGVVPNDPPEIVTELCRGGNAFSLLHLEQDLEISWRQKLKICSDTAAGIGYLHGLSPAILHRDLKSLNLLLVDEFSGEADEDVTIKVCDFGLSRLKEEQSSMTKNVGTTNWLAPEVVGVGAGAYNEKVDVYSFSMTMFEVICREVPFEDEDATGVILLVKRGERPDMEAVPPDCPEPLRRLMEDCWHVEPSKRPCFGRISQALEDIQQAL
jgi:serine/threonine protein kinase